MAIDIQILDPESPYRAHVTNNGQLITSAISYDDVVFNLLDTANTAYNFFGPKAGKQFVITVMKYKADQQVSNTVDATVIVYEASTVSTTTVDKTLHQDNIVRGEGATLIGLNLLVNKGKYINAKTDDDDVPMTIMGYYIDEVIT